MEYSNDCGEHLWSLYPSKKGQSLIVNNSRQLTHPTLHVTYITKRHVKNIFLTYEFNLSTAVWCCCDCCCSSDGFQEPIHPTLLLTGEVYIWHQLVHEQNGFSCLGFISVHLVHWQGKKGRRWNRSIIVFYFIVFFPLSVAIIDEEEGEEDKKKNKEKNDEKKVIVSFHHREISVTPSQPSVSLVHLLCWEEKERKRERCIPQNSVSESFFLLPFSFSFPFSPVIIIII